MACDWPESCPVIGQKILAKSLALDCLTVRRNLARVIFLFLFFFSSAFRSVLQLLSHRNHRNKGFLRKEKEEKGGKKTTRRVDTTEVHERTQHVLVLYVQRAEL